MRRLLTFLRRAAWWAVCIGAVALFVASAANLVGTLT